MRLTKKKAIKICIELWEWLAKTGEAKWDWPGWERYGYASRGCPFCSLYWAERCRYCPISKGIFRNCVINMKYGSWVGALSERTKKKYAKLFLEELRGLQ